MRPSRSLIALTTVVLTAAAPIAKADPTSIPGFDNALGVPKVVGGSCVILDPSRSEADLPPNGWYLVGFSTPSQGLLEFAPRTYFASWSKGLKLYYEDPNNFGGKFGDFFVANTASGPQRVCFKQVKELYYQSWYDPTGLSPNLSEFTGEGDYDEFTLVSNSPVFKLTYLRKRTRK